MGVIGQERAKSGLWSLQQFLWDGYIVGAVSVCVNPETGSHASQACLELLTLRTSVLGLQVFIATVVLCNSGNQAQDFLYAGTEPHPCGL